MEDLKSNRSDYMRMSEWANDQMVYTQASGYKIQSAADNISQNIDNEEEWKRERETVHRENLTKWKWTMYQT